jgi:signal transduction histidine kinase
VEVEVDPDLEVVVDRAAFEHVVDNLVSNAVRHAPAGSSVQVRAEPRGSEVWMEVADEGPGIAPELRDEVFEPFVRGQQGGAGLGLTIVRSFVEAHGGRVWIEEGRPRGTRVLVALPSAADAGGD